MKPVSVPIKPNATVPAYGVMVVSTTAMIQSQDRIYSTIQWTGGNTAAPLVLINRGIECSANSIGRASFAELPVLAYTTVNMAAGTLCGPMSNSWALGTNATIKPFVTLNATDTASNTVIVQHWRNGESIPNGTTTNDILRWEAEEADQSSSSSSGDQSGSPSSGTGGGQWVIEPAPSDEGEWILAVVEGVMQWREVKPFTCGDESSGS